MDGDDGNGNGTKTRGAKKAARPAPATDATQQQPAARAALEVPAPSAADKVDDGRQPVASVDESRAGGGAEEEEEEGNRNDDKQVEMFYALLANIRAMRGLPPHKHDMAPSSSLCSGGGHTDDTAGDSTRQKRLRLSADPPWRPAFRMEDFDEPAPAAAACETRKRTRGAGHDGHGDGERSGQ